MHRKPASTAAAQPTGRAPASAAELPRTKPKIPRKPGPAATPPALADLQLLDIKACCAPARLERLGGATPSLRAAPRSRR